MLEVSKFMLNIFAAIGAIKVGSVGINMIEEDNGNFLLGVLVTSLVVLYVSVSTYIVSNKLSKDSDEKDVIL
jgi:hypothetical protein